MRTSVFQYSSALSQLETQKNLDRLQQNLKQISQRNYSSMCKQYEEFEILFAVREQGIKSAVQVQKKRMQPSCQTVRTTAIDESQNNQHGTDESQTNTIQPQPMHQLFGGDDFRQQLNTESKFVLYQKPKLPKPYKIPFPEKGKQILANCYLERKREIDLQNKFLLKHLVEAESSIRKFTQVGPPATASALSHSRFANSDPQQRRQTEGSFATIQHSSLQGAGFHAQINHHKFLTRIDDENAKIYNRLKNKQGSNESQLS